MNEKELKRILKDVDCEALSEGIKKGKDFMLPVKGNATLHLIFSPPLVRVDFRKVGDEVATKTISLNVMGLEDLVTTLQLDKLMIKMGWEV